jgi:hypothetical protein
LRDRSEGRLKSLLQIKVLKPYNRTQTVFGQNVRTHNGYEWEIPDFTLCSEVFVTDSLSGKYKFSLLDDSAFPYGGGLEYLYRSPCES